MQKFLRTNTCLLAIAFLTLFSFGANAQCDPAFAAADIATTYQGTVVIISVQNNDTATAFGTPVSGTPLTTTIITSPAPSAGTVTVLPNGDIRFEPAAGFTGNVFFTYRVSNSCGTSNTAIVTVSVTKFCAAPTATNDSYNGYNNLNNSFNVLFNDTLPATIPFTITIADAPTHGSATISNNQISFFNNDNYVGLDTLVYSLCYNRAVGDTCPKCDTASVFINIVANCVAPIAADDNASVVQGQTVLTNVLANDQSGNFGFISIAIIKQAAFGTSAIVSNQISYTANNTYTGLDSVVYVFTTTCGSDTAILVLGVAAAQCVPPIAILDVAPVGYGADCDTNRPFLFDVLKNDINPLNCGPLRVASIETQPSVGFATIDSTRFPGKYYIRYVNASGQNLDSFVYITYNACNNAGCDTATLALYVGPYECNALSPTLFNDFATVCNRDTVYINVLKNDFDKDFGQKVKLEQIAGTPDVGSLVIVSDSVIMLIPGDTTYTGPDFFFYQACDDGTPKLCDIARVDLIIKSCANPPVIVDPSGNPTDTIKVSFPEDSSIVLCFDVIDLDSDKVVITSINGNVIPVSTSDTSVLTSTPCINIVPVPDYNGQDSFTVIVCDRTFLCDTVVIIVTVTPVSDGLVAVDDSVKGNQNTTIIINQTGNDYDQDGFTFSTTATFDDSSDNGTVTLNPNGTIGYRPDSTFAGVDYFYYVICRNNATPAVCDTARIQVVVPVDARNDNTTGYPNITTTITVLSNDNTVSGGKSLVTLCADPKHGTAVVGSNGAIAYTPESGYAGKDSFCYTLCDTINGTEFCDNAKVYIDVQDKPTVDIPEGFSPDGDGINDNFVITNIELFPKSELQVFNRWGDIVWRTPGEGYTNNFNGTYEKNNEALADGTYYYVLKLNDGKTKDIVGFVVINR
jgi:gliding motility-associated-like protein